MDETPNPAPDLLPLVRLRATLLAQDPLRLPAYAGSTWRSLLGHGLRQAACVTRARTCEGRLLASHCVYPRVFEPPAPISWTSTPRHPATVPPMPISAWVLPCWGRPSARRPT